MLFIGLTLKPWLKLGAKVPLFDHYFNEAKLCLFLCMFAGTGLKQKFLVTVSYLRHEGTALS
jgi:hypothetical protein